MTPQKIKIKDIKINTRMRKELGDIHGLADSISRHGLIQPVVLDHQNNLIAGGRRIAAHQLLKLEEIDYIFRDQVPVDVQAELEFEENYWRKSMSWQEEALGILNIYRKKKMASALEGWLEPYQQVVARMFQMSVGTVNYVLAVAKKLEQEKDPKGRWHSFGSAAEAYRLGILREEEERIERYNAEELKRMTNTAKQREELTAKAVEVKAEIKVLEESNDAMLAAKHQYESNPHNTIPFEQYIEEKKKFAQNVDNTIYITNRLFHTDCITFMNDPDMNGMFDHIITDPPYAIEMMNLDQKTDGKIVAIDKVKGEHDVEENLALLKKFFPAAWHCTKDLSYVILCCDVSQWDFLKNLALSAGFLVQDWPYIWRKVNQSVANNAAQYNTTKDFEIAMLCRKPSTTVINKRNTSFTDASNVQAVKDTGHPFAKPYELTRDFVEMVSMKGQKILDPFAGGGSMVVQMLRMERNAFGVEKKEEHYNSMLSNVKNLHYLKLNPNYVFK